jgi:VWFA-related protein
MIVGQGGLQGAVIGATIGGGKGAIYGGAAGAAIGLASVLFQRGPELDLPRDILFELRLDTNVDIPIAAALRAIQLARAPSAVPASSSSNGSTSNANEQVPDFSGDRETDSANSTEVATTKTTPSPPPAAIPIDSSSQSQDAQDDFKLKVDVQLVTVDAVVRDRSGRPLESLRKEDFRIFENGSEQTIQTFSRDEYPLAVALVVDRSGSVAPYMRELREAAYKALSQLKRGDQVCLFTFASEVQRLEDLTTDRQRIADRIASIQAGGGTNIIDGLFDATYYLGAVARDRRRIVILISDNEATTRPRTSEGQVIRMAAEMEAAIYSIKTVGEGVPVTMRLPNWAGGLMHGGSVGKITKETGGEIIDVANVGSLDAAMAAVINRIKLRYTLGYTSGNPTKDGSFRKIEVRLTDPHGKPDSDYQISSRRGYYSNERAVQRATSGNPPAIP